MRKMTLRHVQGSKRIRKALGRDTTLITTVRHAPDVMAALAASSKTDDPFIQSAMDQFVLAVKMADADGFEKAREEFYEFKAVLIVDENTINDTMLKEYQHRATSTFSKLWRSLRLYISIIPGTFE